MKKLILLALSCCFVFISQAQQNDTAVLRSNKVYEVKKLQKIHVFEATKDTCILEIQRFDENGRMEYHKMDMTCLGYPSFEESYYVYEGDKLIRLITRRDNDNFMRITYKYEDKEEPTQIKTFFYQTNDSIVSNTKYFRNRKGRMDSSYLTTTLQNGMVEKTKSIARYDKKNNLVELIVTGPDGRAKEMMTSEFDDEGKVQSVGFATYGDRDDFSQTFYEYSDDGRIESTMNNVTQKQEYFYKKNGLLNNVLSYNPKGVLEIEYVYKYKYQK